MANPFIKSPLGGILGVRIASFFRLDPVTGQAIWRYRFPYPLEQGPTVANFTCYQFCPNEGLTAIDIDDASKPKWQRADALSLLTTRGGEAVIRTDAGMIEVVDNQTGETKRSFPAEDVIVSLGNRQGDALYLITADGRINCVRPEGIPYLRHQEIEAARAVLNRPPQQTADIPLLFNKQDDQKQRVDRFRSPFDRGGN